ncbi:type I polyketide synthase [Almyronema epifaneia]|uniref:SDR family NAD(P)-dependent oxidoreductase n=1 Tax=Almyronema epifaneia S1 TaxID=2991925 RepID=A0ABW6ILA6_9CYAN
MSDPTSQALASPTNGLEIAVIGLSGRFPGAQNVAQFWQNLCDGQESITFFAPEELEASITGTAQVDQANYVRAGGVVADSDRFDAAFFSFSPREAEVLDPQHRLFLECAWEALEDAGYDSQRYEGLIGVYGGARLSSYLLTNLLPNRDRLLQSVTANQILLGNDPGNLTTRVSYKLNLEGPSCTVETACSTSLVAVHLACQSLLNGECDMALAGGVGISSQQKSGYLYQEGDILSPDGHCRAFDAQAQGTVSGNGVGLVVLKRLEDAIADGDCIRAVIKGSAINNDGAAKVSYTAPRIDSQAKVIQAAQAIADVDAATVTYIEAHGTGTSLGDPIEVAALTQAFQSQTARTRFCALGSVKTNVGHLGVAAGVTGLIKTVLSLQHQQIPPSLHFQQPNPKIDFANSPFYVNTTLTPWHSPTQPRRAGVSSFGMGGTNAHVVLEEAPRSNSGASRSHQILVLSAKTPAALETATANLVTHLQQHPQMPLADVAYTLQVGRQAFEHRRAVVCQDKDAAIAALAPCDASAVWTQPADAAPQLVFMFPGQGSQYGDMGRDLYAAESLFREHIDRCCQILQPHLDLDLRQILFTDHALLTQTRYTQPALFVIEYALAQLWISWGVCPQVMIGHSLGEYVAACLAGVFSLEAALRLVAIRGQLMQQLPSGSMLAVSLSESDLQPFLSEEIGFAVHNAPQLCVLSGTDQAIQKLSDRLTQQGVHCRRLQTSHAFHSALMDPILEPFITQVQQIVLQPPKIPFISNVTGTWITDEAATDPHYWARHLRQSVRFSEGIATLQAASASIFLEVGPGRVLSTLAKQTLSDASLPTLSSLRHPQASQSDVAFILQTLAQLWSLGVTVDWRSFSAHEQRQRLPLPTYPFERQRYWIEPAPADRLTPTAPPPPNASLTDGFYVPTWKQTPPLALLRSQPPTQPQTWLLLVEAKGWGLAIANQLRQQGKTVITVTCGQQFQRLSDGNYVLNPLHPPDYDCLIQALARADQMPEAIAHGWCETTEPASEQLGFYSLLFLTQAIGRQKIATPLQLTIITNNAYDITGDELLCPESSTALGLAKVIPQEYPHITCYSVDISQSHPESERSLLAQLSRELTAPVDLNVAYRGQHRWVQTFEAVRISENNSQYLLRENGVYIITGGLGQLGLILAQHIAQTAAVKLVLISRSSLPQRSHWQQWLKTHAEQDLTSHRIQQIQHLEQLGAEVLTISANVADIAQMQTAVTQAKQQFGQIHGVIHAAGIASERHGIQALTPADCQRQFQAKVYGSRLLTQVLPDEALDFCLLFSSLASVLGGLGFAAYAAANSFMDAFAHQQRRQGSFPILSINWDAWQIGEQARQTIAGSTLVHAITPTQGMAIFDRLLQLPPQTLAQIVVSTAALQPRIEQWLKLASVRSDAPQPAAPAQTLEGASRHQIEQTIADIWQQVLGVASIGVDDNFFDLGGNSLSSIQVVAQLKQQLHAQISVVSLYEYPTVSKLTALLRQDDSEKTPLASSLTRGQKRRARQKQRL